jgi:hypothetical protein
MLVAISQFLLSEWLWSITSGGYHTPINIFVMIGITIFILRQKTVPSVLLAVSANIFSFLLFTGIIKLLNIDYVPEHDDVYVVKDLLWRCVHLGFIYSMLQMLYLAILRVFFTFNMRPLIWMVWVSNLITAWIMYRVLLG